MKKYEYTTVHRETVFNSYSSEIDIEYLNSKGNEGWKLVSIVGEEAIFVREIHED